MWKQKLKICAINLIAYSVVLVIMVMLAVCYRLYGQENHVLSFDRTKPTVTDIDITKHKGEYGVSGTIYRFDKVDIWGRGRQENIIGVGVSNYAEVKTVYFPNDKWKLGVWLYAQKLSMLRPSSNIMAVICLLIWQSDGQWTWG